MTDEDDLLRAIRDNPDEDTPRLMYADWLDEQSRSERPLAHLLAEQIRAALVVAQPVPQKPSKLAWLRPKSIKDLWRKNRATVSYKSRLKQYEAEVVERDEATKAQSCFRSRTLAHIAEHGLNESEQWIAVALTLTPYYEDCEWKRGLPFAWVGTQERWLEFGRLLSRLPLSRVELRDKRPFEGSWVREGVPQSPRRWLGLRMDRMATESERQACTLSSEIFSFLPSVESYTNWTTYQTHIQAQEALTSACLAWARSPVQQPTEVT